MPTENWYTISDAVHDLPAGWDDGAIGAGATKNVAVQVGGGRAGPATHDDDTSYIVLNSAGSEENQAFNCDWPGPMAVVGSTFTANYRHKTGGVAGSRFLSFTDASANEGTRFLNVNNNSAVYANSGPQDVSDGPTYHPTGAAWSVADFADDKTVFPSCIEAVGGANVIITSIWGSISYTPPSGGFAFLLSLAGFLALPFVGRMADFAQFSAYLDWRRVYHPRGTIMEPHEVMTAWREYREYRWPTYLEMAA